MNPQTPIPFGGRQAKLHDNLTPFEGALLAADCFLDEGTLKGRSGYRAALLDAMGSPGDLAQGLWRFRPSASSARDVAVVGGKIFLITDPSTDLASDGAAGSPSARFGATDNISAATLEDHLYVSSDNPASATYPMVRVKNDYSIQALAALPIPDLPTQDIRITFSPLAKFSAATARTAVSTGRVNTETSGSETYYMVDHNTGGWAQSGDGLSITLAASGADWSAYGYLILAMAPPKQNKGGGSVLVEIGTSDVTPVYETLEIFHDDASQNTWLGPGVAYCKLSGITALTLSKVKYLRFTMQGQGIFSVYGYFLAKKSPGVGTQLYQTTFFDEATGQESLPSPQLSITIGSPTNDDFPRFPIAPSRTSDDDNVISVNVTVDPGAIIPALVVNKASGTLDTPDRSVFASSPVIRQAIPSTPINYQGSGSWRLYRMTSNGWRLIPKVPNSASVAITNAVKNSSPSSYVTVTAVNHGRTTGDWVGIASAIGMTDLNGNWSVTVTGLDTFTVPCVTTQSWSSGGTVAALQNFSASWNTTTTSVSIEDNQGVTILANIPFKPGGTRSQCTAMAARAGRLILGYLNTLYISSFIGAEAGSTDPYPQFPAIALEDADGWNFDIAPGTDEQIVGLVNGDSLYILTNKAVYSMNDLTPNSALYRIYDRGCVSRRGFVYAEDRLFWLSWDGLYMAVNRSLGGELSSSIRRLYRDTFSPGAAACLGYDLLTRSLIAINGTKMLRHSFSADQGREWTGLHTLGDTVTHIASWVEIGNTPQFWMLTTSRKIGRLQAAATRDMEVGTDGTTGTAIPDWLYSTGFLFGSSPMVVRGLLVDPDGPVNILMAKTVGGVGPEEARELEAIPVGSQDEVWIAASADFRAQKIRFQFGAPNQVTVRRGLFEIETSESRGG